MYKIDSNVPNNVFLYDETGKKVARITAEGYVDNTHVNKYLMYDMKGRFQGEMSQELVMGIASIYEDAKH